MHFIQSSKPGSKPCFKRFEICPNPQQNIEVELKGEIETAQVLKIDNQLAMIHFERARRVEWIYLGSPRISAVFKHLIKNKSIDDMIDYRTYSTIAHIDDDIILIEPKNPPNQPSIQPSLNATILQGPANPPRAHDGHDCSHLCIRSEGTFDFKLIENLDAFRRPLLLGWKKKERFLQDRRY